MMVQHLKRRPLSRYLKDFKHSQTHCAHCRKLLDRITLVRDGKIVNKIEISRLDTLLDENGWQVEQQSWAALCRFCGDLHCKTQSDFFDIIGFKQFLFEQFFEVLLKFRRFAITNLARHSFSRKF